MPGFDIALTTFPAWILRRLGFNAADARQDSQRAASAIAQIASPRPINKHAGRLS